MSRRRRNWGEGGIRERSEGHWEVKFETGYDAAGKRLTRTLTVHGTKRDAIDKLTEARDQLSKGTFIDPSKITVGEYVAGRVTAWEQACKITPKTAERYAELVRNQIAPHIGAILLQKLKPSDIEAWHATLQNAGRRRAAADGSPRGLGAATIRQAHRILGKALKEAVKNGLAHRNVAALEPAPRVERDPARMVIVTAERMPEVVRKLRVIAGMQEAANDEEQRLRGRHTPQIGVAAITALYTGLRAGEMRSLRWPDADIDQENYVGVREALEDTRKLGSRRKGPKSKSGVRVVTLPAIVIEALRCERERQRRIVAGIIAESAAIDLSLVKLPQDAPIFAPTAGAYYKAIDFSRAWARLADDLGISEVTFHALRHTHVSQLIDRGVDIVMISKRIGHASVAITLAIYAHLFRKDDRRAADAIDAAIAELGI